MVDATRQDTVGLWGRMLGHDRPRQLELPLEGLPSMRRRQLLADARVFATSFGPKLGVQLLMRVGVPMVAVTTPAVIDVFAPERGDDWKLNLAVGGALGGVWGAMVGAVVPVDGTGARTSRFRAAGFGAAGGVVLAPAVRQSPSTWSTASRRRSCVIATRPKPRPGQTPPRLDDPTIRPHAGGRRPLPRSRPPP